MNTQIESNRKKTKQFKFTMPDTYVLLFIIVILAVGATYIIPAGEFERETVNNMTVVVSDSYHTVESNPASLFDIVLSFQKGMVQSGSIIFLILFMGGLIEVIESTGSIKAGVMKAIDKTKGNEFILIATISVIFAFAGAASIVAYSVIAFVSIGVIIARAMRLDPIVAVAITFGATFAGFNVGFVNPYTVGIAHNIAELPMFSGLLFRLVVFSVIVSTTVWYTWRYAKKVLKDPSQSMVSNSYGGDEEKIENHSEFTTKHKAVLGFVVLAFMFMVYATVQFSWSIDQMAAFILVIAIGAGFIGRIHYNQFIAHFMKGAEKLVYGALVVGAARAILVIMEDGKILDTIVNSLSGLLTDLPPVIAAIAMFVSNGVINFFIPSGSGQAVVVMPIMTPLADMVGITRQVAVQAYQFGDGFTNSILPTSGPLMASLAVAGVPYMKWVRWMMPLFLIWGVIAIAALAVGVLINWGPY